MAKSTKGRIWQKENQHGFWQTIPKPEKLICAGISVHPHIIRKSRAMHLYRSGMPLELLAEFLGHSDPQVTLVYAYADTEMKRNAISKAASRIDYPSEEAAIWQEDKDIIERLCRGY